MAETSYFPDLANQLGALGIELSPDFLAGDYFPALAYASLQVAQSKLTLGELTQKALWIISAPAPGRALSTPLAVLDCTLIDALRVCGSLQGSQYGRPLYRVDKAVYAGSPLSVVAIDCNRKKVTLRSLLLGLAHHLQVLFHRETPKEKYLKGRSYCLRAIRESALNEDRSNLIATLWAQTKSDSTFSGDGHFDCGIADVLHEHGYHDPEHPPAHSH